MFSREAWSYSSSQARGNAREILYVAPAMVFHGVERTVRGPKKLFGRITILRKSGDSCADGKRGVFRFRREAFADTRNDTRSDVLASLGQYQREFVAAVTRGSVNGTGMIAKN